MKTHPGRLDVCQRGNWRTFGGVEVAVPQSVMLEIPSGLEAVLILWVDDNLRISSWLQVTFDSIGLGGEGKLM